MVSVPLVLYLQRIILFIQFYEFPVLHFLGRSPPASFCMLAGVKEFVAANISDNPDREACKISFYRVSPHSNGS